MKTHIKINDSEIGVKIERQAPSPSQSEAAAIHIIIKELQNQGAIDITLFVEPIRLLSVLKQAVSEYEDSIFKDS